MDKKVDLMDVGTLLQDLRSGWMVSRSRAPKNGASPQAPMVLKTLKLTQYIARIS